MSEAEALRAVPSRLVSAEIQPDALPMGRMLILAPGDNVGVIVAPARRGGVLRSSSGQSVEPLDEVPLAHKVALEDLPEAAGVRKYGEVIGATTRAVRRGEHVHVHNMESLRLRGDRAGGVAAHLGARDGE